MVYITAIRMAGGSGHDHITSVRWEQSGNTNTCTTAQMVDFINDGNSVRVTDGRTTVDVGVYDKKWLRTHANGKWSDNLLALPRF